MIEHVLTLIPMSSGLYFKRFHFCRKVYDTVLLRLQHASSLAGPPFFKIPENFSVYSLYYASVAGKMVRMYSDSMEGSEPGSK